MRHLFQILVVSTGVLGFIEPAFPQILVDDYGNSIENQSATRASFSQGKGLRSSRRVGVGAGAAGVYGTGGVHLELNFTDEFGLIAQYGVGDEFQTYGFQVKRVLMGSQVMPYMSGGLVRWTRGAGRGAYNESDPGFLADRFLNKSEKKSGEFQETLLYPAFGIQFLKLSGEWTGFSLFAELQVLIDIEDFVTSPTGGLGLTYYF